MWAAAERHPDVVRLLVEAGADLQAHTKKGFTALHFAAREGDLESTQQLLAAGVNVNIRSQQDEPAEPARESAGSGRSVSGAAATQRTAPRGPGYQATISAGSTPLARGDRARSRAARALPAGARRRSQCSRCRLHPAALGVRRPGKAGSRIRCTASPIR